jgi:flagellar protein FlaG
MELDIRNLSPYDSATKELQLARESATAQKIKNEKAKVIDENAREQLASATKVDAEKYLHDILKITEIFNRKLKFSIDRELEQVIVKVVDSETDKVIKEIPPEVLQRLYSSMKEAIGLIIDEQI